MTNEELFIKINENFELYRIEPATKAMGEDGKYVDGGDTMIGYALVNATTGVVEHTSTILPAVIFQAEHCEQMLKSLLEKPAGVEESLGATDADIIPLIN